MSRTQKQPYRGPRAVDTSCRCHGGCPWCLGNHRYQQAKADESAREQLADPLDPGDGAVLPESAEFIMGSLDVTETIECCAIEFDDGLVSLPRPNRHHHVIQHHNQMTGKRGSGLRQGFITSQNRFVDRAEAAQIAYEAGQIPNPKRELFSEDLWDASHQEQPA